MLAKSIRAHPRIIGQIVRDWRSYCASSIIHNQSFVGIGHQKARIAILKHHVIHVLLGAIKDTLAGIGHFHIYILSCFVIDANLKLDHQNVTELSAQNY